MSARKPPTADDPPRLTHLLGPARRGEVRRIAKRLLIAWALAAGPLYLVAQVADGIKEWGGFAVLTALIVGVPSYLILVAGPTAWRDQVTAAGLQAAGRLTGLCEIDARGDAAGTLAAADGLGIFPDHTAREVGVGLTGTLQGVPTNLVDATLAQTGGTGRRVVFKGLLLRFQLPHATGTTATVHPTPGRLRRALRRVIAVVRRRSQTAVARGAVYTVHSDSRASADSWITPAVLTALADIGQAEGRRLDTTTLASILAGLLTPNMRARAVTAGLQDDTFYLAVDRRASLIREPHPITAPKTPEALVEHWQKQTERVLEPLGALLGTELFRA